MAKRSTAIAPVPPGYVRQLSGVMAPMTRPEPVAANKLQRGLAEAKQQLEATLYEVIRGLAGDFEITEIKLIASFNADGKFLGFGVGGAASIEITVCPCSNE
jgi:hypothetical protein